MRISTHLDLVEVTRSETAKRNGISNQPTAEHLENFKKLAENIFEPIRKHFGVPIHISSGYRSVALNKFIKGSATSQHLLGQALDLDMDGSSSEVTNKMLFEYIKNNLDFDQLINEFNYSWVHVSYNPKGKQRKQILDAKKVNGKTVYSVHK
jgi:zinc D-Ala-D-Ala carboxypeptidase